MKPPEPSERYKRIALHIMLAGILLPILFVFILLNKACE